jgi:hypothetical protein
MSDDDVPVLVFAGEYSEVVFLQTLIDAAGIETQLGSTGTRPNAQSTVYVRRADVAQALELVNDFCKNGKRTERWPWGSD